MRWAARRLASAVLGVAVCLSGASFAQPKVAPEEIEAILGQSLLEQAAFRTCAVAGNDTETAGFVTKGWQLDLGEVADILLKAGYPENYVRSLKARLDIRELPEEGRGRYNTVAGLLQSVSGRLLKTAERVECAGWRFEVLDLDGKRIDKVLASPIPDGSEL